MSNTEIRTLKVSNGYVQGQVKNVLNRKIVEFLAIPYCKPPINQLRFQKPQKCETFTDSVINKLTFETCPPQLFLRIFDGQNQDEETWNPTESQSEDSLYVNIWCPLDILEGNKLESVFVWIYGGGFVSGSSSLEIYNGSVLSSHENIIVVSFNYRLGMLGFLYLDDEFMNGNLGIWDQVAALNWIHDNISIFNGDPENITIGGNSAGGCSVSLHLLIEESWKYFKRALILSGVCYSDWAILSKEELIRRSIVGTNIILDKLNFPFKWDSNLSRENKQSIITYLRTVDFQQFLIDKEIVDGILQFAWKPYVDGQLIKDSPRHLFKSGQFKKCPTSFLNVENEGSYFILYQFPDIKVDNDEMIDMKYFKDSFQYYPRFPIICQETLREKIKTEYDVKDDKLSIRILDKIISDEHFVCDSLELANDISKMNKEVYYFWFKAGFPVNAWPKWCGVMHSDEIYQLFGHALDDLCGSSMINYKDISRKVMTHFGNFIRTGHWDKEFPHYDEISKRFTSIENKNWISKEFSQDQLNKVHFWYKLNCQSNSELN